MATTAPVRIPVCDSDGVITERVDASRARRLILAPNAKPVRKRRGGLVRILLESTADCSLENAMRGNPRSYSYRTETKDNPVNVWALKRIPTSTADIFHAVINELAA